MESNIKVESVEIFEVLWVDFKNVGLVWEDVL